jgi:ATP-dependent exoDNAse (exonuclease V) alpha subunit
MITVLFDIKLDDGRLITISTSEYKSDDGYFPLVQAYASTIYSAQGLTAEGDTLIMVNSYFDRANTYVAGSRHKQNCYWFFNAEETDIALLDEQKLITDQTRLYIAAKWCVQENDVKLASEFLNPDQLLINTYQPSL